MPSGGKLSAGYLDHEAAKCIGCGRCIQACDEIQEKGVLGFVHRGYHTFVSAEFGAWKNSTCDGCRVRVITRRGDIESCAEKSCGSCGCIPFHFHESPANRLTNDVLDPVAKIPELKVTCMSD
ncbi:MAG: hypothetical protein U5P10_14080 [Spirochaetia bacterium]|nr:hypothetical protein [Spirochaetia bacterium]